MTVRCLICNAPGAFICEKKHDDDESDRAALGRVLEWERLADEGAAVKDAERLALTELAADLRVMGLSAVAILMRSILATRCLARMTAAEVHAAIEAPGDVDPIFAPRVLKVLADLRRASVPRSLVRVGQGSPEVDLEAEVPLLAKLAPARGKGPAKDLRRLADAIALGKRRPRQRLARDFNADVYALRVGKRVQEILEAAHRAAPKGPEGPKTREALAPYLVAAGVPDAYIPRLAAELAEHRSRRRGVLTLKGRAALFLRDAATEPEATLRPRVAPLSLTALRAAEAELDRLEKFRTTRPAVIRFDATGTGERSRHAGAASPPRGTESRRRKPDGREAHVDGGSRRGPSRQGDEHPADAVGRFGTEVHPPGEASLVRTGGRPRVARVAEEDLDVGPRPGRVTKRRRPPP